MRAVGKHNGDGVAGAHCPAAVDHCHDASPPDEVSAVIVTNKFLEQARPEIIDLGARVAQACHFHHRIRAQLQQCAPWQGQKIYAHSGEVLAELARGHTETATIQPVEKLLVHQVDLAQIGLGRIHPNPGTVLDRGTRMGVTGNAKPFQQLNFRHAALAEAVGGVEVDGCDLHK